MSCDDALVFIGYGGREKKSRDIKNSSQTNADLVDELVTQTQYDSTITLVVVFGPFIE